MSCSEWKTVKLEEICDIRRGASPRPIIKYVAEKGIPWVKIADATSSGSRYINKTKEFIIEEGKNKSLYVKKGDFILSNSATPGIPKFMGIDACIHDGWLLLSNFRECDKMFLYYKLINDREKLLCSANGSVFKNLKTDIVKSHTIDLPPMNEQKRIVDILSSLDDKIELNNEMNKTLEEMAQSIFKRWFVDFEFPNEDGQPYKSSAGEMVESELGMIPKGWEVKTINEMVNVTDYVANGSFASLKNNVKQGEDEDYAILIRLVDHNRGFKGPYMYVDENGYNFLSKSKLYGGEIIISNVGANAGTVFKAPYLQKPMTLGPNSIMILKSTLDNYLYYYLTSDIGQNNLKGILGGSAQPKFNKTDFRNIQIVLPNDDIIEKFNSVINTIIEKIELISRENRIIESVRDNLLPKLISGQINIDC